MGHVFAILGDKGIIAVIGVMIFFVALKYSKELFTWIENHTFGMRNYILEKFELLFIEVKPEHITYALLFFSFGFGGMVLLLFGLFGMWTAGLIFSIIVSFMGFKVPKPIIKMLIDRRIDKYDDQMVDGLTLLSNGIRAGLSVPQALGMVVSEMPTPISQEFNLILQQNRIGVPLDECFENLGKRVPTADNDMFIASMNILRETGGNLAEVFDTIVDVIRERIRLKQKIKQYTAVGMFQGYIMVCMPFAIGGLYSLSDPAAMKPLFTTPIGLIALVAALGLDALGFFIIMKIVKIKMD